MILSKYIESLEQKQKEHLPCVSNLPRMEFQTPAGYIYTSVGYITHWNIQMIQNKSLHFVSPAYLQVRAQNHS